MGRRTGADRATNADRHDVPHEHGGECGDAVCFPGALPSLVLDEELPLAAVRGLHRPRGDNPGDSRFAAPQHEFRGGIIGPGAVCARSESRLVWAPQGHHRNGGPHRTRLAVGHVLPRTLNPAVGFMAATLGLGTAIIGKRKFLAVQSLWSFYANPAQRTRCPAPQTIGSKPREKQRSLTGWVLSFVLQPAISDRADCRLWCP